MNFGGYFRGVLKVWHKSRGVYDRGVRGLGGGCSGIGDKGSIIRHLFIYKRRLKEREVFTTIDYFLFYISGMYTINPISMHSLGRNITTSDDRY